mgnify:CR=1 FL=1
MKILVGGTPASGSEKVAGLFSDARCDTLEIQDVGTRFDAEDLISRLQQKDLRAAVLVFSLPEHAVEMAIATDADVDNSWSAWRKAAQAMLKVHESNASKVFILYGPSVSEAPGRAVSVVADHLGISLQSAEDSVRRGLSPERQDDAPLRKLIAARSVLDQPDLSSLAAALDELAYPLSQTDVAFVSDWRRAHADYQQMIELADLRDWQISQVQKDVERYYVEAKALRDDCGGGSADGVDELARYALQLERRYVRLLQSRSWKLLAPLREAGRIVKGVVRRKRIPRNRLPRRPQVLRKYT